MLEREREEASLGELLAAAGRGTGGLATIEGPAGIGKSTLLRGVATRAKDAQIRVLAARGSSLEARSPFGVALQIFAGVVDEELFDGPAARARSLFEGSDLAGGSAESAATSGDEDPAFALLHGLHWLLVNLCEREPVLVCVDDAHWGDPLSLRFLAYLAHRIEELPAVLVVAVRSGDPGADEPALRELRSASNCLQLSPEPLSPAAVGELVRTTFSEASEERCRDFHEATAGNPFYLRELLAAVGPEGIAEPPIGSRRLAQIGAAGISRSLLARLGRLSPAARELAAAASIAGDGVTLAVAIELAGLEGPAGRAAADQLAAANILAAIEPLTFAHPIVGEAIYGDLPRAARAQRHLDAAAALRRSGTGAERIPTHLLAAPRSGQAWVAEALRAAATSASQRGDPGLAARYLERALEEGAPEADRGAILLELGLAATTAGDPKGSEWIRLASEELEDPGARGFALMQLGRVVAIRGRYGDGARLFRRAREELEELPAELGGELAGVARAGFATAGVLDLDLREEARPILAELTAAEGLEEAPMGRTLLALEAIQRVFEARPFSEVRPLARRVVNRAISDDPGETIAFRICAAALATGGDIAGARAGAAGVLEFARRNGSAVELAGAAYTRAIVGIAEGRVAEIAADATSAIEAARIGWGVGMPAMHAALAHACLERGEPAAAGAALELRDEQRWTTDSAYPQLLEARARVALAGGDDETALAAYLQAGELSRRWQIVNPALSVHPWRSGAALVLSARGERERGLDLVNEELRLAESFGAARTIGSSLRALGLILGGSEGEAELRRSVEVLAESGAALELARSLTELGAALRRGKRRQDSREPLRRGLELARDCGASSLAERAHTELRASGARPRKLVFSGAESLTPSERRVAGLAAADYSNRQIAAELYLTRKTIESHLTHVYRKLEIASRSELAEALTER